MCFQSQSRIFHSFRDVTLASEGLENLSLCLTLTAFEQGGVLTCHTCYNLGPRFTRSHWKDHSVTSHPSTCQGYSGPIITEISTGLDNRCVSVWLCISTLKNCLTTQKVVPWAYRLKKTCQVPLACRK